MFGMKMNPKDLRVAVYCRVSSEDQAERGTIETQVDAAGHFCKLHNIQVVEWFRDDGVTGTLPLEKRPEGRRLLKYAEGGHINLVLIYKIDRLGRKTQVIFDAVHELEQLGVKVASMTEPFDTSTPIGSFMLNLFAGLADLDRSTILERLQLGTDRAARQGKWLGGIVPYGYIINDAGYLEINTSIITGHDISEANVIELIYRLITEEKMSTIKIADHLNSLGIPTAYSIDSRQDGKRKHNTAGIWRPSRIRNMIVSTTYKGLHQYGKRSSKDRELISREVQAIIPESIWDAAQQRLKDNQLEATRSAKRQYLLRGLIKCSCCGLNYTGSAYKRTGNTVKGFYSCNGKSAYRGILKGRCQSKNIPQGLIEDAVWEAIVTYLKSLTYDMLRDFNLFNQNNSKPPLALESEKDYLQKAIKAKETEKQNILNLYRKAIISFEDVRYQSAKIACEKASLVDRLGEIDSHEIVSIQAPSYEDLPLQITQLVDDPLLPFEIKREIIKILVKEVLVTSAPYSEADAHAMISITLRFPGTAEISGLKTISPTHVA